MAVAPLELGDGETKAVPPLPLIFVAVIATGVVIVVEVAAK